MKRNRLAAVLSAALVTSALAVMPVINAQAYSPTGGVLYDLGNAQCLKGLGNCAVYPKSTQLPDGRLVAAFEKSTVVPSSGSADGQTLPIFKSDDYGTSWQPLSEVKAPAYLSSDPAYAKYTSNWTSPYLYTLPEDVGALKKGTLLLASLVSGDDYYYKEQKAANPNWVPNNDGDRSDLALALYSSTDNGNTWQVVNIITTGGWQGGSAGAIGKNIAPENTYHQVDPVWEPYLLAYNGKLVAYYSDENDYVGIDGNGQPILDPQNDTSTDSHGQILAHRTWDGTTTSWSSPVVDVSGLTQSMGGGKTEIGGGRPGMTNVVPTTDGKWMLTYEYWGGGSNVRYKFASDPLSFGRDNDPAGSAITGLPFTAGSKALATGGSPVIIGLPDGRIAYNASSSGDIWVNGSGRSDGTWTEYQTTVGAGYSRPLQYVAGTGRISILQGTWGGATSSSIIRYGEVDLGHSDGAYYRIVNRKTGQVIGTTNNTTDANIGNRDIPDVRLEDAGSAQNTDTQLWHITTKNDGNVMLLNKSGGRAASIWTGNATQGQRIGQWVDNVPNGLFKLFTKSNGVVYFQSVQNPSLYLTGSGAGASLTLQPSDGGAGAQDWTLVQQSPAANDLTPATRAADLVGANPVGAGGALPLNASAANPSGKALHANVTGHAYLFTGSGAATDLGSVAFGGDQTGTVALPADLAPNVEYSVAVAFDASPLMWGTGNSGKAVSTVSASAATASWGTAAKVTVSVSSQLPVTGHVELTEGTTDRGTAALENGEATFTLPPGLAGGDHTLTAAYSGSDTVAAASTSVTVTVSLPTAWNKSSTYRAGDVVSFSDQVYKAGWYSKGEQPSSGSTGAWQQLALTESGATVWTPSRVFVAGDRAEYDGVMYVAKWYSRNKAPGTADSPWSVVG
ncbi:Ig-like domain repeat protein [Microbacterium sp. 22303]|uniref:Ig-like domain repeat protein n=1 Tax=Microbacterium sp. 22303 TaxID=3453905 RepID=UPI003F855581